MAKIGIEGGSSGQSDDKTGTPSRRQVIKAGGAIAPASRRRFLRIGSALAAYPDRPIKIVVANTPGGPSDIVARMLAAEMQQVMGGSVFVENRGGAGGNIGYGYAGALGAGRIHDPAHHQRLRGQSRPLQFDPVRSVQGFRADLRAGRDPARVRSEGRPAGEEHEGVRRAGEKADPDKFNVSTPPIGTTPQLQAEVLKLREGLPKMATVVFQGGGDAVKAILAGTVQLSSGTVPAGAAAHQGGHAEGAGADRRDAMGRVCPMSRPWRKAGSTISCSRPIARWWRPPRCLRRLSSKLEKTILDITNKPDMKKKLIEAGFDVTAKDGKGHAARIAKEVPMFKKIIADAGIAKL